ncbi:MAG: carbohydrate kinase family protein [Candidatus Portnoybacteria bacterium]|nr:carbohydrate kinase family protein [Candidatus Portnoybacteria bacterium]
MFDVVTFGSATRDIFVRSKDFKIIESPDFVTGKGLAVNAGSKVYVDELIFASGGGGTNTAATFVSQGLKVAYVGLVGNDSSGKEIVAELKKIGVICDFVKDTDKADTPVSIILSAPGKPAPRPVRRSFNEGGSLGEGGERSILVYEGASHLLAPEDVPWSVIGESKWLYLSGLSGESSKVFAPIINFAEKNDIKMAVNPGHDQLTRDLNLLRSLLNKINILIVNQEEASIIAGIDYQKEELFKKLDELADGVVVMSKGPNGVAVSDGKTIYRAGIPESGYVDRTGSGDAFGSGFVSAIVRGENIESAIQLGTANATSVVQKIGAKNGILKKDEWGEWKRVEVEKAPIKS